MRLARTLLLLLLLSGCSTVNGYLFPPGVKLDWDSVSLYADPAANRDFPLLVDVVTVTDENLAKKIGAMKAADWFAARDGLRKVHPGAVEVASVELAPGGAVTLPRSRFTRERVFAALAFADYFSAGEHSARLEAMKGRIAIEFGATEFSVAAAEK